MRIYILNENYQNDSGLRILDFGMMIHKGL
jgi:hypothetical protein